MVSEHSRSTTIEVGEEVEVEEGRYEFSHMSVVQLITLAAALLESTDESDKLFLKAIREEMTRRRD